MMTGSRMQYSASARLLLGALLLVSASAGAAGEPMEPDRTTLLDQYLDSVREQRWADALPPAERLLEIARAEA